MCPRPNLLLVTLESTQYIENSLSREILETLTRKEVSESKEFPKTSPKIFVGEGIRSVN